MHMYRYNNCVCVCVPLFLPALYPTTTPTSTPPPLFHDVQVSSWPNTINDLLDLIQHLLHLCIVPRCFDRLLVCCYYLLDLCVCVILCACVCVCVVLPCAWYNSHLRAKLVVFCNLAIEALLHALAEVFPVWRGVV